MKRMCLLFFLVLISSFVWAEDELKPEPLERAIKEYQSFWLSDEPDPTNHEVWKLYVYYDLTPKNGLNRVPETLVAGLTPDPRDHYYVYLRINQLYNYLRPIPQKGDVIVVDGRIINHLRSNVSTPRRELILKTLIMYLNNAINIPSEHFSFPGVPTIAPIVSPVVSSSTAETTVMTPTGSTQGVSVH